ncbi:hypothetical protein AGMMS50239_29790 [Bacteroidia bacterium]|nr:hypothetical protein AGMMS50239_29790 [Bacteroidia bacterium]
MPKNYATVKYTDKDNNGFFDYIEYDMDGDFKFETAIDLKALGIDDRCDLIDISSFKYKNFTDLMKKMSDNIWENTQTAIKVAEKYNSPTNWYAKLKQASSIREKYHKGYWLQYYLYKDLEYLFLRKQDKKMLEQLNKSYFSGNWESMLIDDNQVSGLIPVAKGWSNNSINAVIFRKNAIVTCKDIQFISYYDTEGFVTLGKRKLGSSEWTIQRTLYKGNINDAHNCISIMADGDGYLHVSWDHHAQALNYAKSKEPFSLELGEKQFMTGSLETKVTYPEFYKMPDGNMLFFYRDGQSGKGNLLLNYYDYKTQTWTQLHKNLIDGENQRNAYWQACVDKKGTIHLSWVWRETSAVETNHDLCYARSRDGGKTWENSKGEKYTLPISASTAEYACKIPQSSELANQTAMTADRDGRPYIANYWRTPDSDAPQYHVVYHDGKKWVDLNLNFRDLSFTLRGAGTKRLPISRPQIIADNKQISLIFRDEERENKVSIATCKDVKKNRWQVSDLTGFPVGMWEPAFDTELWRDKGLLHIFVQNVDQIDNEGKADILPQMVQVMELKSNF